MKSRRVSAVVLAGGDSIRMGQNKALLKIENSTLIERVVGKLQEYFNEIIVVTNKPEDYPMLNNVIFHRDALKTPNKNSLVGLYTGLLKTTNEFAFVVGCDMPFLNGDLIKHMLDVLGDEDILVPFLESHYQPLHAIYHKNCLGYMKEMLETGNYKINNLYQMVNTIKVNELVIRSIDPQLKSSMNINTEDAFKEWKLMKKDDIKED